ncbi:MAG: T9SS type A sorting domain-containing protein [Candidatus Latescibacteria bacterium]|nr:T9SS type A sorting domain-containing protein [Candidatus Latescibacterota bacterium]
MKFKYFLPIVIVLCLIGIKTVSAEHWELFTNTNKISSLSIKDHIIWWSSNGGVVRFDTETENYEVFTILDYKSKDRVSEVYIDRDGIVWFGGDSGLVTNYDGVSWEHYYPIGDIDIAVKTINTITQDIEGKIWCASSAGLLMYDGIKWSHFSQLIGLSRTYVTSVAVDANNIKWFGTINDGLYSYDGITITQYNTKNSDLTSDNIRTLKVDDNNILWVGTEFLFSFDGNNWTNYSPKPDKKFRVDSLVCGKDGIWCGSPWGLYFFDGAEWTSYTTDTCGIPDNNINAIKLDENGILWIGTGDSRTTVEGPGLTKYDGNSWKTISLPGPTGNKISHLTVSKDNDVWIVSDDVAGLSRFDGTDWIQYSEENGLLSKYIDAITVDNNNRTWLGCWNGVCMFDGITWHSFTSEKNVVPNKITTLSVDKNNIKWIFGADGYAMYDDSQWSFQNYPLGLENSIVSSAAFDRNNTLWMGTTHNGVLTYDFLSWTVFAGDSPLANDAVSDISIDADDTKWFCYGEWYTHDRGIASLIGTTWNRYNGDEYWSKTVAVSPNNTKWFGCGKMFDGNDWLSFHPNPGFDLTYNDIVIDSEGNKWLGSDYGLFHMIQDTGSSIETDTCNTPNNRIVLIIHPNPFNPYTTLSFTLPSSGFTSLAIYNVTGQKIRDLVSELLSHGTHSIVWDGKDMWGNKVSSGVYFSRLTSGKNQTTTRMLLIR